MSKLGILASVFALAVGTAACGNSQGQSNSLVDVGPSVVSTGSESGGNLATLAKGGRNAGGSGGTTGGTSGGTISLVLLNSTDGLPHFTQNITFIVSTTVTTKPFVELKCYQNGNLVGQETNGFFDGALSDGVYTLGPTPAWQSGDADCTATLESLDDYSKHGTIIAITSMSFHVYP
jgi:hypothetical protein